MKNKSTAVETTLNYQFTAIPTVFAHILDANCYKMMGILINYHNYCTDRRFINEEGLFYISMGKLEKLMGKTSKTNNLILESLYQSNLIGIVSEGGSGIKQCNSYRVNFETIMKYDAQTNEILEAFNNIPYKEFESKYRIKTLKEGSKINYAKGEKIKETNREVIFFKNQKVEEEIPHINQKVEEETPHIIDILDNKYILNKLYYNINNKINGNNILYNKENSLVELNDTLKNRINYMKKHSKIGTGLVHSHSPSQHTKKDIESVSLDDSSTFEKNYNDIVLDLLDKEYPTERILKHLAENNFNCYAYYKNMLKDKLLNEYIEHRELIEHLNNKYSTEVSITADLEVERPSNERCLTSTVKMLDSTGKRVTDLPNTVRFNGTEMSIDDFCVSTEDEGLAFLDSIAI